MHGMTREVEKDLYSARILSTFHGLGLSLWIRYSVSSYPYRGIHYLQPSGMFKSRFQTKFSYLNRLGKMTIRVAVPRDSLVGLSLVVIFKARDHLLYHFTHMITPLLTKTLGTWRGREGCLLVLERNLECLKQV